MQPVDLVEQARYALDLIHDYPASSLHGAEFRRGEGGITEEVVVQGFVEQVDPIRLAEPLSCPRALPDPAGTEEKEAAPRKLGESRVMGVVNHAVIIPGNMTASLSPVSLRLGSGALQLRCGVSDRGCARSPWAL